jgi:hypothetical protein
VIPGEEGDLFYWTTGGATTVLSDHALTDRWVTSFDLEVDDSGNAHVAWSEGSVILDERADTFYWKTGSTPVLLTDRDATEGQARIVRLELDDGGRAHVAWREESAITDERSDIFYWVTGGPTIRLSDHDATEGRAEEHYLPLMIDVNGNAHVAWREQSAAPGESDDIFYWTTGGTTTLVTDRDATEGQAGYAYLDVDESGKAHIGWSEMSSIPDEDKDLFYWTTGETATLVTDRDATEGTTAAVVFEAHGSGIAHFAWNEMSATAGEEGDVFYARITEVGELWAVEYRMGDPLPGYAMAGWPWFETWMDVRFENRGEGDVFNVTAEIMDWPANVVPTDPDVTVGDIPAGSSAWSTDTFTIRVDTTGSVDLCGEIYWRAEYDDAAGVHHVLESVPGHPPGEGLCPEIGTDRGTPSMDRGRSRPGG